MRGLKKGQWVLRKTIVSWKGQMCRSLNFWLGPEKKIVEEVMGGKRNAVSMVVKWPNPVFWGHTRYEPVLWFVRMLWTTYSRKEGWCTSTRMKGRELRLHGVDLWRKALSLKRTVSVPWSQEGWTRDTGTSATVSEVCLLWEVQRLMCLRARELVIVTS